MSIYKMKYHVVSESFLLVLIGRYVKQLAKQNMNVIKRFAIIDDSEERVNAKNSVKEFVLWVMLSRNDDL